MICKEQVYVSIVTSQDETPEGSLTDSQGLCYQKLLTKNIFNNIKLIYHLLGSQPERQA